MLKKLQNKFIAINMTLVSLVLIAVFALLYISDYSRAYKDTTRFLEKLLEVHQSYPKVEPDHNEPPRNDFKSPKSHDKDFYSFVVEIDSQRNLISQRSDNDYLDQDMVKQAIQKVNLAKIDRGVLPSLDLCYLVKATPRGYRIAFTDISGDRKGLLALMITGIFIFIGALLSFFFISLFLARYALKPVEEAWKKQQHFIADASHELKTPLTVILATSSLLANSQPALTKEQGKWNHIVETEATRMQKLVEDLLFLARADQAEHQIPQTTLNFGDLVENACLLFEPVVFEAGQSLNVDLSGEFLLKGHEDRLKQLVMILIDNALKHGCQGQDIHVSLHGQGTHEAVLKVTNDGSIITPEDLPHLFDRFYRADKSRNRNKQTYGLGLSIAKEIIKQHKGKVNVTSDAKNGTTFTITLPLLVNNL